jgi:hypothetical protein
LGACPATAIFQTLPLPPITETLIGNRKSYLVGWQLVQVQWTRHLLSKFCDSSNIRCTLGKNCNLLIRKSMHRLSYNVVKCLYFLSIYTSWNQYLNSI